MNAMKRDYRTYREIFKNVPKPFAFVDLDMFDANIKQVQARAGTKMVRVASKSVRCVPLLERIFAADPQYQGIMAYNPDEAVFLSQKGFNNILVAYPFWGTPHIEAVAGEIRRGKTIVAMVDCAEHVKRFQQMGIIYGVVFPLCLDVDMSSDFFGLHFGVYRSGIDQRDQVQEMVRLIDDRPNVRLDGLMGYEAQIAGLQDKVEVSSLMSALMNAIVPLLKVRSIRELRLRREAVVNAIGLNRLRFVNAGGTGSLESSILEDWVTEVTAGSGFYSPTLFDGYRAFRHLPAAGFAVEIVRQPRADIYTCLGGGYVASGSAGEDKLPKPYLPEGVRLIADEGPGEVQTPVRYQGDEPLSLGDPIFFRHAKAGELCERFNQLYLVAGEEIVDVVPTYRGEGQCFM
jgi:D-serine deaminase-like pyridoxal phosphate-dependent protein